MNHDTTFTMSDDLHNEMVAYLDGELDAEQTLRIEQQLATDAKFAAELRQLQKSFEMLEELSNPQVADTFAASTVEMIAVEARTEHEQQLAHAPQARLQRWLVALAALAAAIAVGYFAAGRLLPDPNEALLRDLAVIENLDRYQLAGSIDYLRALDTSGLFPAPVADPVEEEDANSVQWLDAPPTQASLWPGGLLASLGNGYEDQRQRLASLTVAERNELVRSRERFENLSPAEQETVRQLHGDLEAANDGAALRGVLDRYYDWYKELPPERRSELRMLDELERLQRVRAIVEQQGRETKRSRVVRDFQTTVAWMRTYAAEHADEILGPDHHRPDHHRPGWQRGQAASRSGKAFLYLMGSWMRSKGEKPAIDEQEWQRLREQLSPGTLRKLDAKLPAGAQWWQLTNSLIDDMVGTLPPEKARELDGKSISEKLFRLLRFGYALRGVSTDVSPEELRRTFANLSESERQRLIQLPAEEMREQLFYRHLRTRRQGFDMGRGDGHRPPHQGRPGPGGPPHRHHDDDHHDEGGQRGDDDRPRRPGVGPRDGNGPPRGRDGAGNGPRGPGRFDASDRQRPGFRGGDGI